MAEENIIQAVDLEPASTEAEQANRTVDKRDPDFQQAEVSEKKDRLGIVKDTKVNLKKNLGKIGRYF